MVVVAVVEVGVVVLGVGVVVVPGCVCVNKGTQEHAFSQLSYDVQIKPTSNCNFSRKIGVNKNFLLTALSK